MYATKCPLTCYAHFASGYDNHLTLRGLIQHAASEVITYTADNGVKYERKLLAKPPSICFKNKNEIVGIRIQFTCPYLHCSCQLSAVDRRQMRLEGRSYLACPFKRSIKFVDSYQFVSSGLGEMVQDLNNFHVKTGKPLEELFPSSLAYCNSLGFNNKCFKIFVRGKFFFPFEKVDSWRRMSTQTEPPPPTDFVSTLRGRDRLSPKEYSKFLELWTEFGIKSMAHLAEIYNKADVLIQQDTLAFYFERIHHVTQLWGCHFYTLSGLAVKAAMLNSPHPDRPRQRLFLQFLDERVYDLFSQALIGQYVRL